MVWVDLNSYNELQKAKTNLEYFMKIEGSYKQLDQGKVVVKPIEELEDE